MENKDKSKDKKIKREKAITFLIKNKHFLEDHGASDEYIKIYVDKQYQEILDSDNYEYEGDELYDLDNVNFID